MFGCVFIFVLIWQVIITGSLDQVLSAFDVIVELLHQAAMAELAMNNGAMANRVPDQIILTLLLEHSKAGKAVGAKGAMMQTIKVKSNASAIRIDKEPIVSPFCYARYANSSNCALTNLPSLFFYMNIHHHHPHPCAPFQYTSKINCLDNL